MVRALKNSRWIVVCVAALLLTGCGKKEKPQEEQTPGDAQSTTSNAPQAATPAAAPTPGETNAEEEIAATTARTEQALKEANQGKDIEPISLDALKAALPADVPNMKCTDSSARSQNMMGAKLAVAAAQFETADGAGSVQITIVDTGNLSGTMRIGMTAWTVGQYNRETDSGYEKTTTYAGYKAVEEYDNEAKSGALRAFVGNRFIVEVEGSGTTMETIKAAMGKIDLKKLAGAGS